MGSEGQDYKILCGRCCEVGLLYCQECAQAFCLKCWAAVQHHSFGDIAQLLLKSSPNSRSAGGGDGDAGAAAAPPERPVSRGLGFARASASSPDRVLPSNTRVVGDSRQSFCSDFVRSEFDCTDANFFAESGMVGDGSSDRDPARVPRWGSQVPPKFRDYALPLPVFIDGKGAVHQRIEPAVPNEGRKSQGFLAPLIRPHSHHRRSADPTSEAAAPAPSWNFEFNVISHPSNPVEPLSDAQKARIRSETAQRKADEEKAAAIAAAKEKIAEQRRIERQNGIIHEEKKKKRTKKFDRSSSLPPVLALAPGGATLAPVHRHRLDAAPMQGIVSAFTIPDDHPSAYTGLPDEQKVLKGKIVHTRNFSKEDASLNGTKAPVVSL